MGQDEQCVKLYKILYERLYSLTLERQMYLENSPGKRNYTLGRLDGQIDALKWVLKVI